MEQIQQSTQYDDPMVKALKALDVGELCSDEWTHAEGIVLYKGRVYVPNNPQLHHDLVYVPMELLLQDILDDGRHWNWCHRITGGQGCPGMLPSLSWDAMHATGQRPSLCRRWGS